MIYTDIDKGYLPTRISMDSGMGQNDAETLAELVMELGVLSGSITHKDDESGTSVYGILIRNNRISVNLSDIAVMALKVAAGMTPLANLTALLETIPAILSCIRTLSPIQQEIAGLMDAWDGRMIRIADFRTFAFQKLNQPEDDINDALDDMADKSLIAIRTRVMRALWRSGTRCDTMKDEEKQSNNPMMDFDYGSVDLNAIRREVGKYMDDHVYNFEKSSFGRKFSVRPS